jgi:DNA repair exonuclease SbcCD ATPase subunit
MAEDPERDNPEDEVRPEWLPDKFKSPEDMARSYAEAERKISETTSQLSQYQEGYSDLYNQIEELKAQSNAPDPQVAQDWLEEQYATQPLQTMAQLAAQAANNAVEERMKQYQQQTQPVQQAQFQIAAAYADAEMGKLAPDWEEYRGKVTDLMQQFPHLIPQDHLASPLELTQDLTQVYQLARSQDLAQRAESAEQRATELEQMKINAQTMTGSLGRPMAPDQQKAEWDAIKSAVPNVYG